MHLQSCCFANLRASSHEPNWPGWPGYRDAVLPWVHLRTVSSRGAKDPGKEFWGQIREKKQTWRNTKILTLVIIASATLKAVLYYCTQMRCLWCLCKYSRQCKTMLSRPPQLLALFRPGNRAEVFIWQNFQPTNRDLGNRASPPFHMNTSKSLRRILR